MNILKFSIKKNNLIKKITYFCLKFNHYDWSKSKTLKKVKDDVKNSLYNIKDNDYKYNLIQIYLNDFINTNAI